MLCLFCRMMVNPQSTNNSLAAGLDSSAAPMHTIMTMHDSIVLRPLLTVYTNVITEAMACALGSALPGILSASQLSTTPSSSLFTSPIDDSSQAVPETSHPAMSVPSGKVISFLQNSAFFAFVSFQSAF